MGPWLWFDFSSGVLRIRSKSELFVGSLYYVTAEFDADENGTTVTYLGNKTIKEIAYFDKRILDWIFPQTQPYNADMNRPVKFFKNQYGNYELGEYVNNKRFGRGILVCNDGLSVWLNYNRDGYFAAAGNFLTVRPRLSLTVGEHYHDPPNDF